MNVQNFRNMNLTETLDKKKIGKLSKKMTNISSKDIWIVMRCDWGCALR